MNTNLGTFREPRAPKRVYRRAMEHAVSYDATRGPVLGGVDLVAAVANVPYMRLQTLVAAVAN